MKDDIIALSRPFAEAVTYFRGKLNIPTEHWDDLWREQHARGFMVAGAAQADLLADLRTAVDTAITKGTTLQEFRTAFDAAVARSGWDYRGGRNWRTRVIFETNIRTAYSAGRYRQMKDPEIVRIRPWWVYLHGESMFPRVEHLDWHNTVLPHDDPWWDTHYTPNGWGCKCWIRAMADRDLMRLGLKPSRQAPQHGTYTWEDRTGTPHQIPVGIDPGWDYAPGKGVGFSALTQKFEQLPYDIARPWLSAYVDEPAFAGFIAGDIEGAFPVAVLNPSFCKEIGAETQTVWLSNTSLAKNLHHHPDLKPEDYKQLPDVIENADLVVQDGLLTEVFIRRGIDLFHAAVKTTKTGKALYLTSFRKTKPDDVERVKRKGKVLRDGLTTPGGAP